MRRPLRYVFYSLLAMLFAAAGATVTAQDDWRTASREPVGLAPDPAQVKEAVVQVYGARAVGAKGLFGVHTWVAVKPTNAAELDRLRGDRLASALGGVGRRGAQPRTGRTLVRRRRPSSMPTSAARASTS